MKPDKKDAVFSAAFNGSLQTLDRIHELLQHCSAYCVNEHVVGYRQNLKEIFKEAQGFLSKAELLVANKKWGEVEGYSVVVDQERDTATFDEGLLVALEAFDFWIRLKLHRHHVTMASKREFQHGLKHMMSRYGLDQNEGVT